MSYQLQLHLDLTLPETAESSSSPPLWIPEEDQFKQWLTTACRYLQVWTRIHLSLADPYTIARLNSQFRGKAKATNVLSFPHHQDDPIVDWPDDHLDGDMVLCPAVVAREAQAYQSPLNDYWAHLTIHGFCHIAGYDHICDADESRMRTVETAILAELGIACPY